MSSHSIMGPDLTEEVLFFMFRAGREYDGKDCLIGPMRGIMAGPTLLNVCHSPAGPSRMAGIESAGSLPPPLRPFPAVLPAAHHKSAQPVSLPRVHPLAGDPMVS